MLNNELLNNKGILFNTQMFTSTYRGHAVIDRVAERTQGTQL